MVLTDFALDPVTAGPLHYWRWLDGGPYFGIPWSNFAGWMVASVFILKVLPEAPRGKGRVGWSVVAFFTALGIVHGLWIPAAAGAVVVAVGAVGEWRRRVLL
jgi:putative membrane protein